MKTNRLNREGLSPYLKKASFLLVFILSFLIATQAWAQTEVADGTWSANTLPTTATGDITLINDGGGAAATVTLDGDVDMAGYNLTLGTATAGNLTIDLNTYSITNIGTFTFTGAGGVNNVTLKINQGTLEADVVTLTAFDTAEDIIEINYGTLICAAGIDFTAGVGVLTISGGTSASPNVITAGGAVSFDAFTTSDASYLNSASDAYLDVTAAEGSDITFTGAIASTDNAFIETIGGNVVFNTADPGLGATDGLTITDNDATDSNYPSLTVTDVAVADIITNTTLKIQDLTVESPGAAVTSLIIGSATDVDIAGNIDVDASGAATATLTINATGADVDVAGNVLVQSTAAAATLAFGDTYDIDIAGDLTTDDATGPSVINFNTGATGVVSSTFDVAGTVTLDNADVTGNTISAGDANTDAVAITFTGTVAAYDASNLTLTNFAGGTCSFDFSCDLGAITNFPDAIQLEDLTINDQVGTAGSITMIDDGDLTVNDLTITSGTLDFDATTGPVFLTVTDTLTMANSSDAVLDVRGVANEVDLNLSSVAVFGLNSNLTTDEFTILAPGAAAEDITLPAVSGGRTLGAIEFASANDLYIGGDLTLNSNATTTDVISGAGTGEIVVGSDNTLTVTTATSSLAFNANATTLNIEDADLVITDSDAGANAFTGLDVIVYKTNTESDIAMDFDTAPTLAFDATLTTIDSLTIETTAAVAATITTAADLHVYGDLIYDVFDNTQSIELDIATFDLTLDGSLTVLEQTATPTGLTYADAIIDASNGAANTITFNGPIDFSDVNLNLSDADILVFGGMGTLTGRIPVADVGGITLGSITVDRPGGELQLSDSDVIELGSLTVTSGTVYYKDDDAANNALLVTGDVEIGQHGEFVLGDETLGGGQDCEVTLCTLQDSRLTVIGEMFMYGDATNPLSFTLGESDDGSGDHTNPTAPSDYTYSDNGGLQVTGTFAANEYVDVAFCMTNYDDNKSVQLNLPATFDRCNDFTISTAAASTMNYSIKLQNDLTVNGNLTLVGAGAGAQSVLQTGKNTLTVVGDGAGTEDLYVKANGTLDASEGNLVVNGLFETEDDATTIFTCNENTNLEFHDDVTLGGDATNTMYEVNSLVLIDDTNLNVGTTMLTLDDDLICHGNLEVYQTIAADEITLSVNNNDITVYGDVISSNTDSDAGANSIDFSVGETTLTVYGDMYDTPGTNIDIDDLWNSAASNLTLNILEGTEGTASQFTLPVGLTAVKHLKLERTAGMKMFGNLDVGTASGDSINIQRGNMDLNGKNVLTLGAADVVLAEVDGKVVNNGVDGGYVTTAAGTVAQTIASGIGVEAATTSGNLTIRRYPKMTIIEGDDFDTRIGVKRYYGVTAAAADLTSITFRIDDDELGNNSFSGLEVYRRNAALATPIEFTSGVVLIDDENPSVEYELTHNSSYTGYGTIKLDVDGTTVTQIFGTGGSPAGFAFASQTTTDGEIITFTDAGGTGLWNDAANWDLARVPTIEDEVIISVPTEVSETAGCFEAASLYLTGTGSLQPSSGDTVCLQLMGDIELLGASNYLHATNGTGRLNFFFGEEGADPISVDITANADYDSDSGIRFHDLTLTNANVQQNGTHDIQLTGDLELNGVSVYDALSEGASFTFYGGFEPQQDIDVEGIASVSFHDIILDNNANVYTNASITTDSKIELTSAACNFTQESANGVPAYFNIACSSTSIDGWDVFEGAYCQFDNLTMSAGNGNAIDPYGDIYLMGDFSFTGTGTGAFTHNENPALPADQGSHPDGNAIIFANTSAVSNIDHGSSSASQLKFDEIKVLRNCNVKTVADFYIQRAIYVENDAEFIADAGDITFAAGENNVDEMFIENLSENTLMFFNLNLDAGSQETIYTYSDFNIQGDLTSTHASTTLNCYDGTIEFNNTSTKSITNAGTLNFHKILIPDAARLITDDNFNITNNGDDDEYKGDAGIEVAATGSFVQDAGTCTFTTLGVAVEQNPGAGYPKQIIVEDGGVLELYQIAVANQANNDVTTEDDFAIRAGANAVSGTSHPGIDVQYADLGGTFVASNGSTITFKGDSTGTYTLVTLKNPRGANDNLVLDNVVAEGINLELEAEDYLTVTGDMTINIDDDLTDNTFNQVANTAVMARLVFSGEGQQTLSGNTTADVPFTFSGLEINKTNATSTETQEVLMDVDVAFLDNNFTTFYLTEGYLNLGSDTLTVIDFGAATAGSFVQTAPSANTEAAINGGSGVLEIAEHVDGNHRFMRDQTFTVNGEPTVYNLYLNEASDVVQQLDNSLTVNNDLVLDSPIDITAGGSATEILTVWGDISTTVASGTDAIQGDNTGTLKLTGTGSVDDFSDDTYVSSSTEFPVNLYVGRAEVLSDDLTLGVSGKETDLTIDCGVNVFDLGGNTLDMTNVNEISRISGSVTANTSSEVIWSSNDDRMPANFFTDEECGTLDLEPVQGAGNDFIIEGDLTVNTEMKGVMDIYTGDNVLEFSGTALIPVFTSTDHIIGNLRQTLTSGTTSTFPLGDGTATSYRPLTMATQSTITEQTVLVSSENTDPTVARGGEPADAIDVTWTITPEGTLANDNIEVSWGWDPAMETGNSATSGRATTAVWNETTLVWEDQFDNLESFILTNATDPRSISTDGASIAISDIGGVWGAFIWDQESSSITDVDTEVAQTATSQRNDAVATAKNRVQISRITNLPVGAGEKSQMTVQLQDQYGQPIVTPTPFEFTVQEIIGNSGWDNTYTNIIPAGETSRTFDLNYTAAAARVQLVADTTGGSDRWLPTTSSIFASVSSAPTVQASGIVVDNITASSADITLSNNVAGNTMVMIKADGLLETEEYPTDGVTYQANSLLGAGSSIGRASVIYNDYLSTATTDNITTSVYGLAPMTQYYVYAFNYADADATAAVDEGSEGYTTKSALNNPKPFWTLGSIDDDLSYGNNNSRAYAKSIGTNSPVRGTIKTATDEDWYCFTVTSAAKNVRATLTDLPGNYNFDIYNLSDRRLRRAIRTNDNPEAAVVNDLPPGTYIIRVYGTEGFYSETDAYELMIETKGSEVFSVTP